MSFVLLDLQDEILFETLLRLDEVQCSAWRVSGVCKRIQALLGGVGGRRLKSTFFVDANRFNRAPVAGVGYVDKGINVLGHIDAHVRLFDVQALSLQGLVGRPFGLQIGETLGRATKLQTLILRQFRCHAAWLGVHLAALTRLTVLDLSNNELLRESQAAIQFPHSLRTLKMGGCAFRGILVDGWPRALGGLTSLDFSGNDFSMPQNRLAEAVAALGALRTANLSRNRLQPASLTAVVEACAGLTGLTKLSLAYNVSGVSWQLLDKTEMLRALARCTALDELSLSGLLVNNGALELANAMRAMPALTALDLCHTGLANFCWYVAEALFLSALPALTALGVAHCGIDSALDVRRFGNALAHCPALERLWVSGNPHDFRGPEVEALEPRVTVEWTAQPLAGSVCATFV